MQQVREDLGVGWAYCHVPGSGRRLDYTSDENPKKAVARKMFEMTDDINARIWLAAGGAPSEKNVSCATCHRGVPVPLPVATVVQRAIEYEGVEAAVAQYRALRARFYERDTSTTSPNRNCCALPGSIRISTRMPRSGSCR
jgi:hypothetical protein